MFKDLFEHLSTPVGQCQTRNGQKCSNDWSEGKDCNGESEKEKKKKERKKGKLFYWLQLKAQLAVPDWLYLAFDFITLKHLQAQILFCLHRPPSLFN